MIKRGIKPNKAKIQRKILLKNCRNQEGFYRRQEPSGTVSIFKIRDGVGGWHCRRRECYKWKFDHPVWLLRSWILLNFWECHSHRLLYKWCPLELCSIVAMSESQDHISGCDQRIITGIAWTIFCCILNIKVKLHYSFHWIIELKSFKLFHTLRLYGFSNLVGKKELSKIFEQWTGSKFQKMIACKVKWVEESLDFICV